MRLVVTRVLALALAGNASAQALPEMDCLIEPRIVANVSSAVPGLIKSIPADRGDTVRKGGVVAQLDARAESAALEVAKARAEFGARTDRRNEDLYKDELISIHEKDESQTESLLAQLEYHQATVMVEMRTIKSPIAGVVMERYKAPGEYVQGDEILRVAQIHPLNVEVVVPVEYVGMIKAGDRATVQLQQPVGGDFDAKVTVVDSVIDAASSTFGVRLSLPNPRHQIPAGLRCRISFSPAADAGVQAKENES